jgi:GH25 family lysozyme M1 (1,4-beta-N-acetylmuramidase)
MKKVIDISDYSENLDWNAIAQNEDGVIIKISEGRTPAEMFEEHLENALGHGIEWGVYCLSHAQTTERAEEEAQRVIDILNSYGKPPLYVWFDIEPEMASMVDADDLTAIASAFVSECNANGFDCGIYGNYSTLESLHTDWLAKYVPYWSAEPGSYECDFKEDHPELNVKVWQYEFDNTDYNGVVDKNEWWES